VVATSRASVHRDGYGPTLQEVVRWLFYSWIGGGGEAKHSTTVPSRCAAAVHSSRRPPPPPGNCGRQEEGNRGVITANSRLVQQRWIEIESEWGIAPSGGGVMALKGDRGDCGDACVGKCNKCVDACCVSGRWIHFEPSDGWL
jgi:hypothetical protein